MTEARHTLRSFRKLEAALREAVAESKLAYGFNANSGEVRQIDPPACPTRPAAMRPHEKPRRRGASRPLFVPPLAGVCRITSLCSAGALAFFGTILLDLSP
jgi:hypothetical protein